MLLSFKLVLSAAIAVCSLRVLTAQDLRPRAYVITPVHWNAVIVGYAFNDGSIFFGSVLPITNVSGGYSVPNISYYDSLSFFKRSANFTATLPYVVGNFKGEVIGNEQKVYRSGLADSVFRFSVNLIGGPAMVPKDFAKWFSLLVKQPAIDSKRLIGRPSRQNRQKLLFVFSPDRGHPFRSPRAVSCPQIR